MTLKTGGCLCGAVRYELTAEPIVQVACHCRACQRASGGSPTLGLVVPRSTLNITKGEPRFYWSAGDSGGRVGRAFCEVCGAPVFSEPAVNPDIAVIKAGSLDDPSAFAVQMDMWMGAAQPWHRPHDGAARFDGNPTPP